MTVKVAGTVPVLPSITVASFTDSVGVGSLSLIVPSPWLSASVAFVGPARFRKNVSLASSSTSEWTTTGIGFVVWPGSKESAPITGS